MKVSKFQSYMLSSFSAIMKTYWSGKERGCSFVLNVFIIIFVCTHKFTI